MSVPVTQKKKDEPDEFVLVKNKKSAGGLIPYARWGKKWSATPIPMRPLIRELALLAEKASTLPTEIMVEQDIVHCKNCDRVVAITDDDGKRCSDCGELICVRCGCTESAACGDGCDWAADGICTECEDAK